MRQHSGIQMPYEPDSAEAAEAWTIGIENTLES